MVFTLKIRTGVDAVLFNIISYSLGLDYRYRGLVVIKVMVSVRETIIVITTQNLNSNP